MSEFVWSAIKLWLVMHPVMAGLLWSGSVPEHAGRKSGRMALVGVVVSMVVLIAAVVMAEPALDWLGVTEPTFVIAVGALMVVSAVPVWTPVRTIDTADRGWFVGLARLWLWLASPAVIALAAWVSLDQGIFTAIDSVLLALFVALGVLVASSRVTAAWRGGLIWVARALSAGTILVAIETIRTGIQMI